MAKQSKSSKGKATAKSTGMQYADPGELVSQDERQRMIAEAAYFRAAQRGFQGGDPVADWLAAEHEVNRALPTSRQQREELAAYQQLRREVQARLTDIRETITTSTVRDVIERAIIRLKETGGQTTETVNKVAESVKKDIASAAERMGPRWEAFSERSADVFDVWRDRGSSFLSRAAAAVGDWLQQAGRQLERTIYRTGEMAGSGNFECATCGERLTLEAPAHLPRCAKCRGLEYRRR